MSGIHADRMVRALERLGWTVVRSKGSHHALARGDRAGVITIPIKKGRTLPEGLAHAILKQAGVSEAEFFGVYR